MQLRREALRLRKIFKGGMCDGPKEGPVTRNKT